MRIVRRHSRATTAKQPLQAADADYAVQFCREMGSMVSCRVTLRLLPKDGSAPKRPNR